MFRQGAEKDVVDTLKNSKKPLELGYIMVKNRSPREIEDGLSLRFATLIRSSIQIEFDLVNENYYT